MPATNATALCQMQTLPAGQDGRAPEWIHLLPAGTVHTLDGRGPYLVKDAAKLARESLQAAGGRMVIDENHSTDLAAPKGLPAPARGWIVELDPRTDGIWGRVEWTDDGSKLVGGRAYRGISPVITHLKDGRVTGLKRASLINTPNLVELKTLHGAQDMDLLAKLRKLLGLADDADEFAIIAACEKLKSPADKPALQTALQAQLSPIAKVLGLKDDADAAAVLQAATTLTAKSDTAVQALQSELKTVTTQFNTLQTSIATDKATAFVDAAIKGGRVGVKPLRDHYIAMHAVNAARVEKEINAMPVLTASGARVTPPTDKDGKTSLNSAQATAAKLLGLDPEAYLKTLAAEAANEEAA